MQKLDLHTGGHPISVDDFMFLQSGMMDTLKGMCEGFGKSTSFILNGVVTTTTLTLRTITSGYIYHLGEVYPVDAHSVTNVLSVGQGHFWQIVENAPAVTSKLYQDGNTKRVYYRASMKCVVGTISSPPSNSVAISSVPRYNPSYVPTGAIIMWSGLISAIPTGWALCDGAGGRPNLKGKFIVGYDPSDADYNNVGNVGGLKTVSLTKAQIPPHKHDLSPDIQLVADTSTGSSPLTVKPFISNESGSTTTLSPYNMSDSHLSENGTTDGLLGSAHENRPPFYTLAFIIKL